MNSSANTKTAFITGANRGIGREIAGQLAAQGFHVLLGIRNATAAAETVAALRETGATSDWISIDCNSPESIHSAVATAQILVPRLDVLINNAAILTDRGQPTETLDVEALRETLETNVVAQLRVTQAFLPLLRKSKSPRIINMSSRSGQFQRMQDDVQAPAYQISKTALNALTCLFSAELKGEGFAVNCMSPGWCRTEMGGADATSSAAEGADTAVWLATEAPQSLTGKFIHDRAEIPW